MNAAVLKSPKPMQELGRYQFSLRRMFIATTAVAAVFGLAVWGGWVHSDAVVYLSIAVVAAVFSSIARRTLLGGCVILGALAVIRTGRNVVWRPQSRGRSTIALDICRFPASLRHDVAALHQGWRILALGIAASGRDICSNGDRVYVWPSDPISSVCQRGSTVCYPTSAKLFPHHRAMADRNTLASGDRSRRGSGPTKKGQTIVNDHCCQELKRGEVHAVAHHRSTGKRTGGVDPSRPEYASRAVDAALAAAESAGASDVHLQPTPQGLELKFRVDGVLLAVAMFPAQLAGNIIARLKVKADLLTYHTDRPQEGRIRLPGAAVEMRREHVSDAARRAGGGATLRRHAAISAAGRPRAAARTCWGRCGAAGRNVGGDPRLRAGRQRQDDDPLRLPARVARQPPASGASCRSKTPLKWPSRAWRSRRSGPPPGSTWPWACDSSCGRTPRSSWSAKSATVPPPKRPCKRP